MDATRVIMDTFQLLEQSLERAIGDLKPYEVTWRPSPWANSIGFTLWHMTRAEDRWVHKFAQNLPEVFSSGGWARRWNIDPEENGVSYTVDKLAAFPTPPLEELSQYHQQVRQSTLDFLARLTPDNLDQPVLVENPQRKGYTIGRMFSRLLWEVGQHVGQICYLRGLQRGMDA